MSIIVIIFLGIQIHIKNSTFKNVDEYIFFILLISWIYSLHTFPHGIGQNIHNVVSYNISNTEKVLSAHIQHRVIVISACVTRPKHIWLIICVYPVDSRRAVLGRTFLLGVRLQKRFAATDALFVHLFEVFITSLRDKTDLKKEN